MRCLPSLKRCSWVEKQRVKSDQMHWINQLHFDIDGGWMLVWFQFHIADFKLNCWPKYSTSIQTCQTYFRSHDGGARVKFDSSCSATVQQEHLSLAVSNSWTVQLATTPSALLFFEFQGSLCVHLPVTFFFSVRVVMWHLFQTSTASKCYLHNWRMIFLWLNLTLEVDLLRANS